MGDVHEKNLKEELETCKQYLVDIEMVSGRHRVFNFVKDILEPTCLLEKLSGVFDSLKCTGKLNVAFGFVLKNVEYGNCRLYHAHKCITLLEQSKLVATVEDSAEVKNLLVNTDFIESCTR